MSKNKYNETSLARRQLLSAGLGGLVASGISGCSSSPEKENDAHQASIQNGDVILFQGDSITDSGRSREHAEQANSQEGLGTGYAWLAGAGLLSRDPRRELSVFNRGISGHKVFQLADRWDADCLDLKPNLVSILIGVNDIWHARDGHYDGTVEVYERDFHKLIERTRKALPGATILLCEPFVLRCGAVDDSWFPEFDHYRAAARRVSAAHATRWVPFQTMFDEAIRYAPPEHWAGDGVHPTKEGAALMAQAWLKAADD
jgi:lysophospholipase L1-like esterase